MAVIDALRQALGLGFILTVIHIAWSIIYNLFFHPLRRFPGPLFMRATRMAACYRLWKGTLPFDVLELHRKYGDVVRIAPDELAFAHPSAWKEIMGHRFGDSAKGVKAPPELEKADEFYRPIGDVPYDIITARGPEHAMLRKHLSHGFSDRGLRDQESTINKYVDLFIAKLRAAREGRQACRSVDGDVTPRAEVKGNGESVDLTLWYNSFTFDVIGDLAFGESFDCLESGKLHPWVMTIFGMIKVGVVLQMANYFPLIQKLIMAVLSSRAMRERRMQHGEMTMEKLTRRIDLERREGPRNDLMEGLLRKRTELNLSLEQLQGTSSIVIIAGSETTATTLAGVTYLLLKNPDKMAKVVNEVRTAFSTDDAINFMSLSKMTYMIACLEEALRMYPPTPTGLPRKVSESGVVIGGEFIPNKTTVAIHHWAMYHNEKNFKNPFLFHPERFLEDPEYASDRKEAFQPFSYGPRNCLGRNLAFVEMRLILAKLLWNFDLELAEDSQQWMETQKIFNMWEKGSLNVYLKPRA